MNPRTSAAEKAMLRGEPDGELGHYYWPSEFPIALCGHLSAHAGLAAAQARVLGPICEDCARHAHHCDRARVNPHA
ncbi:MAG TPA: hypothetical protein VJL31_13035 [Gemmatimonadales bacterium]|nr:hypothetical protein [Gemmatimonadales bacterium]